MISIICPVLNEENFIGACIDSIIAQDYPHNDMELIVADGMSNDNTRIVIEKYIEKYSWIKLIDNPEKIVPTALNRAIKEAKGDIIIRIDAHSTYPSDYVSILSKKLIELDADNVGGVWNTLPANNTLTAIAIAEASKNPFGIGDATYRIGSNEEREVDTVPFGCFRRSVFDRLGLFDEELARNQDDEFNGRIINNGGKIFIIPSVVIDYYARPTLKKMSKMFYQYGLFKPLVNKKLGKPATIRQFFPPLFVLGVIGGLLLSFILPFMSIIYSLGWLLYLLTGLFFSIKYSSHNKAIPLVVITFLIIHFSYGWGYLKGLWRLVTKKDNKVEISR
ncbi:MAG: glycosyltransferase [Bacteroidales bacterium]|nr:glycosyltransferase [Bacteroidales bacterium]